MKYKMLAAMIAAAAFTTEAGAISIDFSQPTINLAGGPVVENVTVSGLTAASQAVSGYDLFISFDNTALSLGGISQPTAPFTDATCSPGCDALTFSNLGTGVLELAMGSFASDATLVANQGDSVLLASFTATPLLSSGTSALGFDFGNPQFQVTGLLDPVCNGIAATDSCPFPVLLKFGSVSVPEPSTLALMALGLLGAVFGLRRRRSQA
ncbi:MAG: PEP-CTERM sorting domain-containing protein [Proteobacteria bacterium]|nr:PEP-CTERM sorting domain-containing protein [Pseudomonadota bacterium]